MHVHSVFVTKYRRGVFTAQVLHDLRNIFTSVCSDFESQLMEFDGEDDPVHLLVNYPPKITVAALVNSLKGVSGRLLRLKNYPSILRKLLGQVAVVAELLRRKLRWRTHRRSTIH
jgi:putative transposase